MVQVSVVPQWVQRNPDGWEPKASPHPSGLSGWVGEKFDSGRLTAAELKPNPKMLAPFVMVNEASIVPLVSRVNVTDPWLVTGFPLTSMVNWPVTESAKAPTLSRQRHNTSDPAAVGCRTVALDAPAGRGIRR